MNNSQHPDYGEVKPSLQNGRELAGWCLTVSRPVKNWYNSSTRQTSPPFTQWHLQSQHLGREDCKFEVSLGFINPVLKKTKPGAGEMAERSEH